MSGIRPPDCSKLAKNLKNDNDVTIFQHDVNIKISWLFFVFLVKFSYWSKFHVKIITGSRIMTIFFIGDWPEIWKLETGKPRLSFSQYLETGASYGYQICGMNASNRMLLNAAKFQGYSFNRFWVIKEKPTGGK